jgi:Carboxypeptidase regulatory-like domain
MTRFRRPSGASIGRFPILLFLALGFLALVAGVPEVRAQGATTGGLTGVVTDESGGLIPGATVDAVHTPTGTRYSAVTGQSGRFTIVNARAGGPYSVTVHMSGFKDQEKSDVYVRLGEETSVGFKLVLESVTETVTVTAEAGSLISPSQMGAASNVSEKGIETLPTVGRGLEDFARLNPYFNTYASNNGQTSLSVAGRNNRYNNVQIDGAVYNDLFGLAASGTPGGQTETQPISIDAIQEIQLLVSPYDVRQGGFSGGGLNAITKSGTNTYHGTAYYFGRNQGLVGDGIDSVPVGTFSDKKYGASLGGPFAKDKAFFFANVDITRKDTPSGWSIGGSGQDFGHEAEATRFRQILMDKYGYDPGGFDEFIRGTNSNKVFARLDFNVNEHNRLTVRHNYDDAKNDIGFPSSFSYYFPSNFYSIKNKTNSSVAQLNSTWGTVVNELRLTYTRIRDNRGGPDQFPYVLVDLADGSQLRAGTEEFSTANRLDQDIVELTDEATFARGRHLFTVGTHNEFFKFDNLFIRDNFGAYRFTSLDNLEAGLAQSFDYSFSVTGDPQQSAKFKVNQLGFYLGDTFRVNNKFTLTYGVRLDVPNFPDKPTANPAALANFGYATDVVPSPKMWSPRAGFNYDINGDSKQQVRGGVGLFSGRTPYVWLSNQYGNTGIEFQRLRVFFSANNKIPFVSDPNGQPTSLGSAATNEVDVVDPNYKFPELIRGNLAYDRDLGFWGLFGSVEMLFSKTVKDIDYQNLNFVPSGNTLADGRPLFTRKNSSFSDVILLTNTDKGSSWDVSAKLERPFRNGLYASASYRYGTSKSVNDGTSSQAASNWGNAYTPGDPNHLPVTTSNFAVGHRVTLAASYDFKVAGDTSITLSAFYNGQSGQPYSTLWNGDANGDGRTFNDMIFVPSSPDQVIVKNGTYDQLDAYINADPGLSKHRGEIIPRNADAFAPWINDLDMRLAIGIPVNKTRVELTMDVLNVLNLIDHTKGIVLYPNFQDITPFRFSVDPATGKIVYDLSTINSPTFQKFNRDDLRSRWQAQWGVRVRF